MVFNLQNKLNPFFRQSREEHDAHVAALGKEEAEMEQASLSRLIASEVIIVPIGTHWPP